VNVQSVESRFPEHMMAVRNRLHELQLSCSTSFLSRASLRSRNTSKQQAAQHFMETYLSQVGGIRELLNDMEDKLGQYELEERACLALPSKGLRRAHEDTAKALSQSVEQLQHQIRERMQALQQSKTQSHSGSDFRAVMDTQEKALSQRLLHLLSKQAQIQSSIHKERRALAVRLMRLENPHATEEDVDEMMESSAIFTFQRERAEHAEAQLSELEQQAQAIKELETSMQTLVGLFHDVQEMIVQQGGVLEHSVQQVEVAEEHTRKGLRRLISAKYLRKASRGKKWLVIALVAIAAVLVVPLVGSTVLGLF
jgi:t-SNARE complex subunit (syntaxin)